MAKSDEKIQVEGMVIEALPGTQFKVRLDNDHAGAASEPDGHPPPILVVDDQS